jgi:hypothetical protein
MASTSPAARAAVAHLQVRRADEGIAHLCKLPLRELGLGSCFALSDAAMDIVSALSLLEDLNVENVPLTDAGLAHICGGTLTALLRAAAVVEGRTGASGVGAPLFEVVEVLPRPGQKFANSSWWGDNGQMRSAAELAARQHPAAPPVAAVAPLPVPKPSKWSNLCDDASTSSCDDDDDDDDSSSSSSSSSDDDSSSSGSSCVIVNNKKPAAKKAGKK